MKLNSKIIVATLSAVLAFVGQNTQTEEPNVIEPVKVEINHSVHENLIHNIEEVTKQFIEEKKAENAKNALEKKLADSYKKKGYYTQILSNGKEFNFVQAGVLYENGIRYTYYSSRVLYHHSTASWNLGYDGIYRDKDGYIIVASSDHAQGAIVHTPFGKGIVRDSGCASGTIDIYTAL
ncbi:MAG: hypothetical protein KBT48_10740 [Firmicutes bacterium]|nr:hypothetical protein [Bacillota bacterium]